MAEIIATIKQGQLKGVEDTDLNGENFLKFLGIPYAKPPVGPLRFKAPQPAESWTGVRDATKEGSSCLTPDIFAHNIVGSEDCLFLNVFTKELPKAGLTPKAVMFFIHGGAFTLGSGGEQMAGPKYLVAEDIILVTINYRLGIFGFLSSDDPSLDIPGNAGLKDQTLALKWVQKNISSFNGDPNNVTIFGISAGGASVHFQLLSPTAKGLFHKAIAQSGSALNPWAWGQKNIIQMAEKLGEKVSNDKDAFKVLTSASSEELYKASQKIRDVLFDSSKRRPFGPVIEKPNPTAFLTENPIDLLAAGKFIQVPTILGFASNEGMVVEMKMELITGDMNPKEIGAYWSLGLEENSQKHSEIKTKINQFYFKDGVTDEAKHKLVGDVAFITGIIESTKLAAKTSKNPVFLYVLSYDTALSKAMFAAMGFSGVDKFEGVPHGGDSPLLFSSSTAPSASIPDPKQIEEIQVPVRLVTKIWADFARTGRPHHLWEPVKDVDGLNYFDIDKELKLKVNPFKERVAFWQDILREVGGTNVHIQENATF